MVIVAINKLPQDKDPLANPLAGALGKTPHEAMARLRGTGPGPLVAATFKDSETVEKTTERLREAGFETLLVNSGDLERENERFIVRRFEFSDDRLRLESVQGPGIAVPYEEIELILRGISSATHTETETVKERKVDGGMALMTGGLKLTKTARTSRDVTTEERESFINLYCGGLPVIVFGESRLNFDSLGANRQPTRTANFQITEAELRKRCPSAVHDNRLVNRVEQVKLLGPLLDPRDHMHIATAVLAKALRPSRT